MTLVVENKYMSSLYIHRELIFLFLFVINKTHQLNNNMNLKERFYFFLEKEGELNQRRSSAYNVLL